MKGTFVPFVLSLACFCSLVSFAQPLMETGGQQMPDEWIDRDTHHKVIKLTRNGASNMSFYFHNNPFIGNKMVYYSSRPTAATTDQKLESYDIALSRNKQLYLLDLATLKSEQLTSQHSPMNGEIVQAKTGDVYYQIKDSVWCVNVTDKKNKLVYVFPKDFQASVTTVNADGLLLAGVWSGEKEKELLKDHPNKSDYFNLIYEARLPRTLFTVNVKTGQLTKLFTDSAWLNHVQFSSTDPALLMFCHEGPWHKVDRIWTINIATKKVKLMHKRSMDMEIAGHEWFSPDGKRIWYDLQQPRGETFFVSGTEIKTNKEMKYSLQRDEWSIHFNISPNQKFFCGDGGDPGQVAKAQNGEWIYFFKPEGDQLVSTKLVNMKHHNYHLEPNVHFSPDGEWIVFRANFEGIENVYAVKVEKEK